MHLISVRQLETITVKAVYEDIVPKATTAYGVPV